MGGNRPSAFRLDRSAWRYFWVGIVIFVGFPLLGVGIKALTGSVTELPLVFLFLGLMTALWAIVIGVIAATQKVTLLDPATHEISLRGEPWIPVSQLTYGFTAYVRGVMAVSLGTRKENAVWISAVPVFGSSRIVRQWAHWLVQASSIPSEVNGRPASGESREDLLRVTSGWAA